MARPPRPATVLAAFAALAAVALAGCIQTDAPPADALAPEVAAVPEGSVRFLSIGDQGSGEEQQKVVAAAMYDVCLERGCQFVLTNGDNIYPDGVRSPFDPQFEQKFEIPYARFEIPFFLTLGNHDNGNGAGSNPAVGEHEVAYTFREDRMSDKWNMPARYYTFTQGDVQFFALDSGPQQVSQAVIWLDDAGGTAMAEWFAEEMAASTATWKFAFAHHPYISNGQHGDAGRYDNVLGRGLNYKLMLEDTMCGNVDVFFAGHDHDLQWLQPVQTCGDTEFIVSGAGGSSARAKGAAPDSPVFFEAYETFGFVWVDVTGDTFTADFYDIEGNVLFERSFTR